MLSAIVVYIILNKSTTPEYKLAWIVPTLVMPIFGGIVYLIYSNHTAIRLFKKLTVKRIKDTQKYLGQDQEVLEHVDDPYVYNLAKYMNNKGVYPIYENTSVKYFPSGERMIKSLIEELKSARHFIFMEYFIIHSGEVWDEILKILKEKAASGVDVRIMYDGVMGRFTLPDNYHKTLEKYNIRCRVFNPFRPFLSSVQNNRDHRKIAVIDGHTVFNGGVNLADEYANIIERFGHWKDTAVMLKGDAAWSLTIMFLQMWDILSTDEDYSIFSPEKYLTDKIPSDGMVMPYGDAPTDGENIGELVYLDIINKAHQYVYITTPYLILDNKMLTALGYAAKSGVDVRIIVPGIPDKWYCYRIAQSYYKELIDNGVRVYEYTPGFVHAKNFVSDDTKAVVGTINLDYRSLYLHFECGTFFYRTPVVAAVKEDLLATIESSTQQTYAMTQKNIVKRLVQAVLRVFAPLI
jgi:cardiolipin synthase